MVQEVGLGGYPERDTTSCLILDYIIKYNEILKSHKVFAVLFHKSCSES